MSKPQGCASASTGCSAELEALEEAIAGSLAGTYRHRGKPSCHRARGRGHSQRLLTVMVDGAKRVEHIPAEWVEEILRRLDGDRQPKRALAELLTTSAELVVLSREQQKRRPG